MHTTTVFSETKTKITNESHKYLRESVGTEKFKDIEEKVVEWINQFEVPSKIVVVKPPATYQAFIGGFKNKVTYTITTIPNIHKHLKKLDLAVDTKLIPNLTDGHFCNKMERKLPSLPVKYDGMRIQLKNCNCIINKASVRTKYNL